ncbi:hypothetical protein C0J52_16614 [Blattella germanica]|nr:hypothetical protein C0J52_16614 [Blattella germanica]
MVDAVVPSSQLAAGCEGGVRKDMYPLLPKQIQSRHGYEGCLANLDLNGESPNLMVDAVVPSSQLAAGCEESIAYEFGPGRGLITYTYPEDRRPELKSDLLVLGKEDAVLVCIDSGTSNDYMELEIVEGNIFMVYNMGTNDHPIGEIGVKVNDNAYHVVKFTRSGANSTIQIDDCNVQTNHPSGHQLSVFNSQSQIQIGGKWNHAKQRIERPFSGVMAGLVFNSLRLLDLAFKKDVRTSVRGDVQLMTGIRDRQHEPLQRMQQMLGVDDTKLAHAIDLLHLGIQETILSRRFMFHPRDLRRRLRKRIARKESHATTRIAFQALDQVRSPLRITIQELLKRVSSPTYNHPQVMSMARGLIGPSPSHTLALEYLALGIQ